MRSSPNKGEYKPADGLVAAVQVAKDLKMPLLVTGEPGTGKTDLAYWIKEYLESFTTNDGLTPIQSEVFRFNTKTTSSAKDLFYRYDALRHFGKQQENPIEFITFEAFGKAIINSRPAFHPIVLVDEIDKAPRDFPNDVLYEFEALTFKIEEASPEHISNFDFSRVSSSSRIEVDENGYIKRQKGTFPPFLLLTSNSEKNLPDAFLRRCLFYHITFPEKSKLLEILGSKSKISDSYRQHLESITDYFLNLRREGLKKPPATDELIKWIESLEQRGIEWGKILEGDRKMLSLLGDTLPVLVKNKEDWDKATKYIKRGI